MFSLAIIRVERPPSSVYNFVDLPRLFGGLWIGCKERKKRMKDVALFVNDDLFGTSKNAETLSLNLRMRNVSIVYP